MSDNSPSSGEPREVRRSAEAFVTDIMEREAELATAPPPSVKRRSRLPIVQVLVAVFAILLVWNVARFIHNPPVFSREELDADAQLTLFLTAQGLEAYWISAGTLPTSLEAVELDDEDLRYARLNDSTYVLTMTAGTTELEYHRGDDISRFATAFDVLVGEAER